MLLGGNLNKKNIFKNILSIGYEFETGFLSKMILYDDILYNTDVTIGRFSEIEMNEELDVNKQAIQDAVQDIEQNEIYVEPEIINNNINDNFSDRNIFSFQISTDATNNLKNQITSIIKKDKLCKYEDEYENEEDEYENEEDEYENEEDEYKDNLYLFRTPTKGYKIKFLHNTKRPCYLFTDVEWIITYYKIKPNHNIIIETFINAISNIINHINKLEKTSIGSLQILNKTNNKYIDIIPDENRILYNVPNTSVYYLTMGSIMSNLDNIVLVPQMTFSCKIQHLFGILLEISKVGNKNIVNNTTITDPLLNIINIRKTHIENTYNIINKIYTLSSRLINSEIVKIYHFNNEQKEIIKNYIGLILYKLYMYFNIYNDEEHEYFKNILSYNSRHTNFELYTNLIKYIYNINNNYNSIDIINNIILQPKILNDILEKDIKLRKNVFVKENKLDVNSNSYGNPKYSLRSYFDHFTNPKKIQDDEYEEEIENDWLVSNQIDNLSSRMELKENIVLIESRSFPNLLLLYCYNNMRGFDFSPNKIKGIMFYKNFVDYYNNNLKLKKSGGSNNKQFKSKKIKKSKNRKKNISTRKKM